MCRKQRMAQERRAAQESATKAKKAKGQNNILLDENHKPTAEEMRRRQMRAGRFSKEELQDAARVRPHAPVYAVGTLFKLPFGLLPVAFCPGPIAFCPGPITSGCASSAGAGQHLLDFASRNVAGSVCRSLGCLLDDVHFASCIKPSNKVCSRSLLVQFCVSSLFFLQCSAISSCCERALASCCSPYCPHHLSLLQAQLARGDDTDAGNKEADWDRHAVQGSCMKLEKKYFRLTGPPDPGAVRPPKVLRAALDRVVKLYRAGRCDIHFAEDQLKAMRQDVTVQHVRGSLPVQIYEAHARACLEHGNGGDFNQCQTQLKVLYAEGSLGCVEEFLAYRVLYQSILRTKESASLLATLEDISPQVSISTPVFCPPTPPNNPFPPTNPTHPPGLLACCCCIHFAHFIFLGSDHDLHFAPRLFAAEVIVPSL